LGKLVGKELTKEEVRSVAGAAPVQCACWTHISDGGSICDGKIKCP
jgi:hypothetical protein